MIDFTGKNGQPGNPQTPHFGGIFRCRNQKPPRLPSATFAVGTSQQFRAFQNAIVEIEDTFLQGACSELLKV